MSSAELPRVRAGTAGANPLMCGDPVLMAVLVAGLASGLDCGEPGLRLRSAIELERITRTRGDLLAPHQATLLGLLTARPCPEVQGCVAQLVPRMDLDDQERAEAVALMVGLFEESPTGSVEAAALQAIIELAESHPEHHEVASRCAQQALASRSASLRERAWRIITRRQHR